MKKIERAIPFVFVVAAGAAMTSAAIQGAVTMGEAAIGDVLLVGVAILFGLFLRSQE